VRACRKLFVTYAAFDRFVGGYVDIFDTEGRLLDFFSANSASGPLQNPFSVVLAPEDFGEFSGKLLIGNQDNGHINAYDPETYQFLGPPRQDGKPIAVNANGMAGMTFGGGSKKNGRTNQLFFVGGDNFVRSSPAIASFGFIVATHHDGDRGGDDHDDNDQDNDK
jgi:hypothetical protein